MRLLKRAPNGGFCLTKDFVGGSIPSYAILSHTWGPDSEEVTFQDLMNGAGKHKTGYEKIRFCADQAEHDGLLYFWIDTCCINKENSSELAEAINSMFRWYHDATRCYVFLSDVSMPSGKRGALPPSRSWESAFRTSRWFTRGWTLQELLAPKLVQFFAQDGTLLGDKVSLQQLIHEITGVAVRALRGDSLALFKTEERFKWAESRQTTREEDWAYSLLGIFGVFISPIYGEGKENAVRRLNKEISDKLRSEESPELGRPAGRDDRQVSTAYFLVLYTSNPDFVGRSGILDQLKDALGFGTAPASSKSQARVSLHGLGGIGKTQIALAYVYWLQQERPEVSVFWVHASSAERFRQAYFSIAKECSIPGHDDPKVDVPPLVKSWLERKNLSRWLMVIDNADDAQLFSQPGNLGKWIPECTHGSVLVTTRNKVAGSRLTRGRCLIEVGKMDEGESRHLLHEKLDADGLDGDDLSTLSSRLEHLPLALVQAAAFIQEMDISVQEYLQFLEKSDQHLVDLLSEDFETVGRDSETPHAVVETWILSFEQIQRQDTFTGDLLSLMSLFDRQAIPRKFLSDYGARQQGREPREEIQLIKALGVLKAFSFITEDKGYTFSMHRLVQLVTRKWLGKRGTTHRFVEEALLVVSRNYPYGNYENRVVCNTYLPHAFAVLNFEGTGSRDEGLARASLLDCAAGLLNYQGQWKEAEGFLTQSTVIRKELQGEEHASTLASVAALAVTYWTQGWWENAELLGVPVMETRKKVLGTEHPDTLTSMANLASTYTNQGRWKEAEELGVQVIETSKRVLGEEHPNTLISMGNLALTYRNQGRWKEAEELGVQVIETSKRVLGEEHPSTLISMGNLVLTYYDQGRWKEAEELGVQVMETSKRVLGEEHPDTLISIGNLVLTYYDQGRWKEAEELGVQVMETRKRVLGEEHPDMLISMGNLVLTYCDQGRWKEAEELGVQVIETRKRVLGEEHPSTLISMGNLTSTYRNQGRWKEAEELGVQVMETSKRVLGEEHPDTLTSIDNLASTYRNQGRWKEAEELGVQVMETSKRVLGEEHPSTLTSMANLAHTWKRQRRLEEALDLMSRCTELQQQILGPDHPHTVSNVSTLRRWKAVAN
ncbi:hypothetical protein B0T14DRAFT_478724 [Immersiella caudata]|uniref:Kinesin light chain n=1 Tax=Immersiella caudata TaxID=314043 RepID=A0AA39WNX3_9PEZI|nr:hypothetical protein B0T14DRAFT_478724 [Immersiella caudata]